MIQVEYYIDNEIHVATCDDPYCWDKERPQDPNRAIYFNTNFNEVLIKTANNENRTYKIKSIKSTDELFNDFHSKCNDGILEYQIFNMGDKFTIKADDYKDKLFASTGPHIHLYNQEIYIGIVEEMKTKINKKFLNNLKELL